MASVDRFEDLACWQEARALKCDVYRLAERSALAEDQGLRFLLTSAAVAVMSRIAKGFAAHPPSGFLNHLDAAQRAAAEVRSLLYVVLDQGYASPEETAILQERSAACQQMIRGLMKHLRDAWPQQHACARYDLPSWFTITSN